MISVDWFWPGFVLNNRLCDKILSWCWISFSKKVKVKLKKWVEGILCYFWHFFDNFCFWPMKRLFLNTWNLELPPSLPSVRFIIIKPKIKMVKMYHILYTFVPNKPFGSLLKISPSNFILLKTFNSEFQLKYGLQSKIVNH